MSASARRLKANRLMAGKACPHCSGQLAFGDDAAICQACGTPHHGSCWDNQGGCGKESCSNAPLGQLPDQPVPPAPAPPAATPGGLAQNCPHCGAGMMPGVQVCPQCRRAPTPSGVPQKGGGERAPGAMASLVFGILSFFICGLIFGWVAISKSKEAKAAIETDPSLTGGGMATAGMVLGIVAIALWVLGLFMRFSQM